MNGEPGRFLYRGERNATMNWITVGKLFLSFLGLLVVGTLSCRLLDVRLTFRMRLFASFLGSFLGGVLTGLLWYSNRGLNLPLVVAASSLFFTMVMAVLIELLVRPGRLVNVESHLMGLPNP